MREVIEAARSVLTRVLAAVIVASRRASLMTVLG
jgi:hypothetical protein